MEQITQTLKDFGSAKNIHNDLRKVQVEMKKYEAVSSSLFLFQDEGMQHFFPIYSKLAAHLKECEKEN